MTAYDTQAIAELDASASPALPPGPPHAAALLGRVLHDAAVFALLLTLVPLAFRLYLIVR